MFLGGTEKAAIYVLFLIACRVYVFTVKTTLKAFTKTYVSHKQNQTTTLLGLSEIPSAPTAHPVRQHYSY